MFDVLHRTAAATRGRRRPAAVGLAVLLGLAVPAHALVVRHAAGASAVRTATACRYAFYDPKADAPNPVTQQQTNQLDLVKGTLGLNRADTKLRVVMNVKRLSKSVPAGANYMGYEFFWTNPSGDKGPNAVDVTVSSGKVTYQDGTESLTGNNYQFTPSAPNRARGSFGSGSNGAIEVDVPLKALTLKVGQVLKAPSAFSSSGANAQVVSLGSISDQDGGPHHSKSYRVGQATCIDR